MGLRPSMAPTGYLNSKKDEEYQVIVDQKRASIIKEMFEKVAYENYSGRKIYRWLKKAEFKNKNGKAITLGNIYHILRMTFYCGVFEYPAASDERYTGKHTPIITKGLFEAVQEKTKSKRKKSPSRAHVCPGPIGASWPLTFTWQL